jgi:hypothetical protein
VGIVALRAQRGRLATQGAVTAQEPVAMNVPFAAPMMKRTAPYLRGVLKFQLSGSTKPSLWTFRR